MVWSPIEMVASNLAFTWENIVLLLVILGSLVFYAKDFKLGLVIDLLLTAGLFVGFYVGGGGDVAVANWVPSLVMFFMFVILLTLTLLNVNKYAEAGGLI